MRKFKTDEMYNYLIESIEESAVRVEELRENGSFSAYSRVLGLLSGYVFSVKKFYHCSGLGYELPVKVVAILQQHGCDFLI